MLRPYGIYCALVEAGAGVHHASFVGHTAVYAAAAQSGHVEGSHLLYRVLSSLIPRSTAHTTNGRISSVSGFCTICNRFPSLGSTCTPPTPPHPPTQSHTCRNVYRQRAVDNANSNDKGLLP
jgi:hypothetical protein